MPAPQYQLNDPMGGGGTALPPWAQDVGAGANLAGNLYSLYNAVDVTGKANTAWNQSNPFGGYRPFYGQQLFDLMQNPSSVSRLPGYQFLMDQGVSAIDRSAAAPGGIGFGSTGEKGLLMNYGQGLADKFYQEQVGILSGLSGSNISPTDPFHALMGMTGAGANVGSAISGIMNPTLNLLSKMFPGAGGAGGGGGPSGIDLQSMQDWNTYNLYSGGTPINDPTYQNAMGMMQPPAGSVEVGQPYGDYASSDGGGGGMDLSGLFSGFKAAGGEAATMTGMGGAAAQLGLGLASHRPGAAITSGLNLASRFPGLSPDVAKNLGMAGGVGGNVLSIIQGLKTGGVSGYGQAGIGAAGLATRGLGAAGAISSGTASEIAQGLGYAAIPLSVYNFAKNWQSGATGQDALQGAATGAQIGSVIPGVGTLIGGLVGGAVGAISSAFGGGITSQEAQFGRGVDASLRGASNAQRLQAISNMNPGQSVQLIQGYMNAHDSSVGHSEAIQRVFGKNGVTNLLGQMMPQINAALHKGTIPANASPQDIYAKVVAPWLASRGASINPNTRDVKGNPEGQNLIDAIQAVIGDWQSGMLTSRTQVGVGGQTIGNLPWYGG